MPQLVKDRIVNFLSLVVEAGLKSGCWQQYQYPAAFAGALSSDANKAKSSLALAARVWDIACTIEGAAGQFPGLAELRAAIYWLDWPVPV